MPVRLESDLEKRVVKAAEAKGWWALKLVAVGHRGFPDRWFIKEGAPLYQNGSGSPKIIIIEFKAPGKRARKLQVWVCDKLRDIGFEVHHQVDNWEDAAEILNL